MRKTFFLSGGVDSSIIVASSRNYEASLDAKTVGFWYERNPESNDAFEFGRSIGASVEISTIEKDGFVEYVERIIDEFSEPLIDPTLIPFYKLCYESTGAYKVVITGEGADEAFFGYPHWNIYRVLDLISFTPGFFKRLVCNMAASLLGKNHIENISST